MFRDNTNSFLEVGLFLSFHSSVNVRTENETERKARKSGSIKAKYKEMMCGSNFCTALRIILTLTFV